MKYAKILVLCLATSVTGCLPVDLDVNDKGEILLARQEGLFVYQPEKDKLTRIDAPGEGLPVFARFDPTGEKILLVRKWENRKTFLDEYRFDLVPLGKGEPRTIFSTRNIANVVFSPDGKKLAVIVMDSKNFARERPDLYEVDVKTGEKRLLIENAAPYVRWFADSRRILLFQIREEKNSRYEGDIVILNTDTLKTTDLARAVAERESSLDLSPDNRMVLFTATEAANFGRPLANNGQSKSRLFSLDVNTRRLTPRGLEAEFVRFSPDGKKVLLTQKEKMFFRTKILIADANGLNNVRTVVEGVYDPVIVVSTAYMAFPGWVNDHRIYYFMQRRVYGTAGKALHLFLIDTDGRNKQFAQPDIDQAIDNIDLQLK